MATIQGGYSIHREIVSFTIGPTNCHDLWEERYVTSVPHGFVSAKVLLITSTVCVRGLKTLRNGAERLCFWSPRALESLGSGQPTKVWNRTPADLEIRFLVLALKAGLSHQKKYHMLLRSSKLEFFFFKFK